METLNRIILSLNKEDIRNYKLIAKRMYDDPQRKDLKLFDYIRNSEKKYDEETILSQLYPDRDKNSFYRLKNRLIGDINESIISLHYRKDEVLYIYHLLSLQHFYYSKNQFDLALRFLKKAEAEATRMESYELLDIIYGEFIRFSHQIIHINPEIYIKKRKENQVRLTNLRQIDDVLAALSHRLIVTQNFSEKEAPVMKMMEKTINEFTSDKTIKKSPMLRFRIYNAVSQILLQKHDYLSLEKYLLATYSAFTKEKLFNKGNHNAKIQMLHYLVNCLFKNQKHEESLKYTEELKKAMGEFDGFLEDKYLVSYFNSLVINYAVINKDKAIQILEGLVENKTLKINSFYENILLFGNLFLFYFDKHDYHQSIRNLNKLFVHESFKNADLTLKFKFAVSELIIRFELKDFDLLEYKIAQVRKDYRTLLKQAENKREVELIALISLMKDADSLNRNKKLLEKVRAFLKNKGSDDTEIIKYNTWLASKIR